MNPKERENDCQVNRDKRKKSEEKANSSPAQKGRTLPNTGQQKSEEAGTPTSPEKEKSKLDTLIKW